MFNLKKLFLFSIALISFNLHSKAIVWDLGGVLFETNKMKAAGEIGIWDLLFYGNKSGLKDRVFEVLNTLGEQDKSGPIACNEGKVLPGIMCKWMTGEINGPELIEKALNKVEELDKEAFFTSKREKKIIQNTIKFMFDPEKLASATRPNKKTLKVLKECAKHPEHQLYIISNWDNLSFDAFYNTKSAQEVFKYFYPENIVVSARIGMIKPHNCIFEHFLNKHNLNAKDCIFIDDQSENIKTAQELGFTGILHKDAKKLKKELKNLSIL
ncbi:HAD-IA family hydrolase [Candidatus Dependentiae bacterium]|nr:HAD-IA family hydrolase [Candidatus Dependentiae bacterium]